MATRILHIYIPKQFAVLVSIMIFLAIVVSVIVTCVPTRIASFSYDGPMPPARKVPMYEDGEEYQVLAAEGQVLLVFKESVSHKEAIKIFKENNIKVLAQYPNAHYYMVEVPVGKESHYISNLASYPEVSFVYPNALEVLSSVSPRVIDDLSVDKHGCIHGEQVAFMMAGNDSTRMREIPIYDIGQPDSEYVDMNKGNEYLCTMLDDLSSNKSMVINLSIGVALYDKNNNHYRVLWDDPDVNWANHWSYKVRYRIGIKNLIEITRAYNEKDFVITKSIGNEGMKDVGGIINDMERKLSDGDRDVYNRHFILVSARDDNKEGDYPNDVVRYHSMVTKVDISDMTAHDLHYQGTSFAAPRAAYFILKAADEYDMKAVDVLRCVRRATRKAIGNILTYSSLAEEVEREKKEASYIYGSEDIIADLVGKTIYVPSDNEYLGWVGSWHLDLEEIVDVFILNIDEREKGVVEIVTKVYLKKGELRVDAEMLLTYQKTKDGMSLESWSVNQMTIPPQQDYSQYVKLQFATDFIPGLEAYNYSDVSLFVVVDYVLNGEHSSFVDIIEPLSSTYVTPLDFPESYSVRFAYRM